MAVTEICARLGAVSSPVVPSPNASSSRIDAPTKPSAGANNSCALVTHLGARSTSPELCVYLCIFADMLK